MIYLAGPYSHISESIRDYRFKKFAEIANHLMRHKNLVFSPIVHGHVIAECGQLPLDFAYWKEHSFFFLRKCSQVLLLTLDGWEKSVGVRSELAEAYKLDIPIKTIDPQTREIKEFTYVW